MSDEKKYTEREKVLAERNAFVTGSAWRLRVWQRALSVDHTQGEDEIAESHKRYPLPKVTRPRVVRDPHTEYVWSGTGGRVQCRHPKGEGWTLFREYEITPERVKVWADLLANPTEEVEE